MIKNMQSDLLEPLKLIECVKTCDVDTLKELLFKNANVNHIDSNGDCAVLIAIKLDNYEIFKLLFDAGANLRVKSKCGISLLEFAKFNSNDKIVSLITKKVGNVPTIPYTPSHEMLLRLQNKIFD